MTQFTTYSNWLQFTIYQDEAGEEYQRYNTFSGGGSVRNNIPSLVKSGMKFGNFKDLGKARMPKYNPDENDRTILVNTFVDLTGNPILAREGERIIITDLEHENLKPLKEIVRSIHGTITLNDSESLPISDELYFLARDLAKTSNASIILKNGLVTALLNNPYSNNRLRSKIIHDLFQGNSEEAKDYIKFVKQYYETKNLNSVLGICPGNFSGMRLLCVYAVASHSYVDGNINFNSNGSAFGINDRVADAQNSLPTSIVTPTLEETLTASKTPVFEAN